MKQKTDLVQTRVTPCEKMAINRQVARGGYRNRSEFVHVALNLLVNDKSGVFSDVSKHFTENYVLLTETQYEEAKTAYHDLQGALHALNVLTDDYLAGGPNHYKNLLRDYLIPRLYASIKQYEDANGVAEGFRVTD